MVTRKSSDAGILVVDDDPALLGFIGGYLTRHEYTVTACRTSAEAWEQFGSGSYALALIDFTLPGISGEQLSRKMLDSSESIRLILTSGFPINVKALFKPAGGRVAFLHTPFTPAMLVKTVERLLQAVKPDHAD